MFESNIEALRQAVEKRSVIRHVSMHNLPDGTQDVKGNLALWNRGMAPFEKVYLCEKDELITDNEIAVLQGNPYFAFIPAPKSSGCKQTIIIAPGGGFTTITGCEGVNAAWYFHNKGFATAILSYRLWPYSRLDAISDMQKAMRILRANKKELGIDGRIALMGFSAGAMLSANCATHYDEGTQNADQPFLRESCKPEAVVMGYGAFSNLCKPMMFLEEEEYGRWGRSIREKVYLAPEKNLTVDTPPFFIWQPLSDDGRHGLNLAKHLSDMRIHYELHIFDDGVHGVCMADGENDLYYTSDHVHHWGELCAEWLTKIFSET